MTEEIKLFLDGIKPSLLLKTVDKDLEDFYIKEVDGVLAIGNQADSIRNVENKLLLDKTIRQYIYLTSRSFRYLKLFWSELWKNLHLYQA